MTMQEQKNCPMISSKATVASRNSLHWSCKPLIRLRKILASRSLKGEGGRPEADRVGAHGLSQQPPTRPPPAQRRRRPPSPFGGGIRQRAWLGRHAPFW